jgi:nitroreductase
MMTGGMAMDFDDLDSLIKGRRSIRLWQEKPVTAEQLVKAVELATWAPNGGNQQNWRFYVIVNQATINAIGDAVQQSASQIASWAEATELMDAASGWAERAAFFRAAPAAIAIAASQYQSPVDKVLEAREKTDPKAAQMRRWRNIADSRIQSAASAIAYLLLILHQMGLGAVWMTGPIQAKEQLEKIIGVAPGFDLVAFVPVGYPAESPEAKGRRPVAEVCEVIK